MMCRSLKRIIVAFFVLSAMANVSRADIKLRIRTTENERSGESVIQIKGRRQRNEFTVTRPDGTTDALAVIFQCDLKRQISFDYTKPVFYEQQHLGLQEFIARAEAENAEGRQAARTRTSKYDGRLVETFTVIDTGERKPMFGYTARHIKTTLTWEATPHGCAQTPLRKETDGWYVDLLYGTFCSYDISGFDETELTVHEQSKCRDYYLGDDKQYSFERRQVGAARFGFPLLLTVKAYGDDGRATTRTSEVTEITNEELDASLFEPPANYTRFKPKKRSLASRALSLFGKG
jgi:hypothetical protein